MEKYKIDQNTESLIIKYNENIRSKSINGDTLVLKARGIVNSILSLFTENSKLKSIEIIEGLTGARNVGTLVDRINIATHHEYENNPTIHMVQKDFCDFWEILKKLLIYQNEPIFQNWKHIDEIEWIDIEPPMKTERVYIISKKEYDNFLGLFYYKVVKSNDKNPLQSKKYYRAYLNDGNINLAFGSKYNLDMMIRKFKFKNNALNKVKYKFISSFNLIKLQGISNYLPSDSIKIYNEIVKKTNENVFHLFFGYYNKGKVEGLSNEEKENFNKLNEMIKTFLNHNFILINEKYPDLNDWIKRIYLKNRLLQFFVFLRNPFKEYSSSIFNTDKEYTPIYSEFWTKNPLGKRLTLYDKDIAINYFKDGNLIDNDADFGRENAIFDLKLKMENIAYEDVGEDYKIDNEFPENDKFRNKKEANGFVKEYDEKKIITFKINNSNKKTTKEIGNQIEGLESFLGKSYKIFPNLEIKERELDFWNEFTLTKKQVTTIKECLKYNISIIKGTAGSGKTVVAATIIKYLMDNGIIENTTFAATTIKASRLGKELFSDLKPGESIPNVNISTLQSLKNLWENEEIPDNSLLIIDEISMVSSKLWEYVILNSHKYKIVILLGDSAQLPPIESVPISDYLFDVKKKNSFELKEIVRTRSRSLIDDLLIPARKGELIKNSKFLIKYNSLYQYVNYLENIDNTETKVISPINDSIFGVNQIQEIITRKSNDEPFEVGEIVNIDETSQNYRFRKYLYVGKELLIEKVEQDDEDMIYTTNLNLKNENLLPFTTDGFFSINNDFNVIFTVSNDERNVSRSRALSVHKSQGSTYNNVVFVIPPGYKVKEKMFYTAVSRAKCDVKIMIHENDVDKYFK